MGVVLRCSLRPPFNLPLNGNQNFPPLAGKEEDKQRCKQQERRKRDMSSQVHHKCRSIGSVISTGEHPEDQRHRKGKRERSRGAEDFKDDIWPLKKSNCSDYMHDEHIVLDFQFYTISKSLFASLQFFSWLISTMKGGRRELLRITCFKCQWSDLQHGSPLVLTRVGDTKGHSISDIQVEHEWEVSEL